MPTDDSNHIEVDTPPADSSVHCDACQSLLNSPGQQAVSFLLVDELRIPLVGCEAHVGAFRSICGMTTEDTAELLQHRPAGGLTCPRCQLPPQAPARALLQVQDGAITLLACPEHQAAITTRFQTGLHTHHQLTTPLDTSN